MVQRSQVHGLRHDIMADRSSKELSTLVSSFFANSAPNPQAEKTGFLKLPAGECNRSSYDLNTLTILTELRNIIYDLTQDDSPHVHLHKRQKAYTNDDWSHYHIRRQYKGLTQVCHEIRIEFLPLYNQRTNVFVCLDDAGDYTSYIKDSNVWGHVRIYYTSRYSKPANFDILPLMRLYAIAKGLRDQIDTFSGG